MVKTLFESPVREDSVHRGAAVSSVCCRFSLRTECWRKGSGSLFHLVVQRGITRPMELWLAFLFCFLTVNLTYCTFRRRVVGRLKVASADSSVEIQTWLLLARIIFFLFYVKRTFAGLTGCVWTIPELKPTVLKALQWSSPSFTCWVFIPSGLSVLFLRITAAKNNFKKNKLFKSAYYFVHSSFFF